MGVIYNGLPSCTYNHYESKITIEESSQVLYWSKNRAVSQNNLTFLKTLLILMIVLKKDIILYIGTKSSKKHQQVIVSKVSDMNTLVDS